MPKVFEVRRADINEDIVKKIVEKGTSLSISVLFIYTGNMMTTTDELITIQE